MTCESWKELKRTSAREGLIALAYERDPKHQGFSRLIQMSKNYLFAPSSGLYSCPLAMTDGAAKTLEVIIHRKSTHVHTKCYINLNFETKKQQVAGLKDHGESFKNLTSRDPERFWTSGQWMTEKRGRKSKNNFFFYCRITYVV